MADYVYKAIDTRGRVIKGAREANDMAELDHRLRQNELELLVAWEKSPNTFMRFISDRKPKWGKVSLQEQIEFSHNMGIMLTSGVPLVDSMIELREDQENNFFKRILESIIEDVSSGTPLNQGMRKQSNTFPYIYTAAIEIGENTGKLDMVFLDLAKHYQRIADLRKEVLTIMAYPIFLIAMIWIASFYALFRALPALLNMLNEFGVENYLTKSELISKFVTFSTSHSIWVLLALSLLVCILLIYFFLALFRIKLFSKFFDYFKLYCPWIKNFFIQSYMAFFARYLSLLQATGVDILKSLDLTVQSINNRQLRKMLNNSRDQVESGTSLSKALKQNRFIPSMVIRMISVGEKAGTLSNQLEFVTNYYERGLQKKIQFILALMPAAIIVMIGIIILALIYWVGLPVYETIIQSPTQYNQF